jgi:hypothetical protein
MGISNDFAKLESLKLKLLARYSEYEVIMERDVIL